MNPSGEAAVSAHASWARTSGRALEDVLIVGDHQLKHAAPDPPLQFEPVCLERAEEDAPCIITLLCRPDAGAVVSSVQVVSEARTVELYSLSGDYLGTSRGEEDQRWHQNGVEEKKHFYRTQFDLETPVPSCEIKLLSLGGRTVVGLAQLIVGLRFSQKGQCYLGPSPGIDLQRVQSMMQEMGATLSPGAQNLMEMVQFQQKNKADMLAGFLPLLMGGGALASLAKRTTPTPPQTGSGGTHAPASHPLPAPHTDLGGMPVSQGGQSSPISPDLLPMLQSVCGQVTQLRLDTLKSPEKNNSEREEHLSEVSVEKALEKVVEKRMEELEKKLTEHMDARLDALQQKLELSLQRILTHTSGPQ